MPTTRYVFVINNYTDEHIARLNSHDNWSYIRYSKEGGKSAEEIEKISEMYGIDMKIKANTPHLQGYIELFKQQKLMNFFGKELSGWWFSGAKGTAEENINYVNKAQYNADGTLNEANIYTRGVPKEPKQGERTDLLKATDAIDNGMSYRELVLSEEHRNTVAKHGKFIREYIQIKSEQKEQENLMDQFANFEPRPWQQELLDILSQDPDPRHVHWIWDAVGNHGKSFMSVYLATTQKATIVQVMGSKSDMAYICSQQPSRIFIFDLSRKMERKQDGGSMTSYDPLDKMFDLIEDLKKGWLVSTKYHGHSGPIRVPHVIIFANFPPNKESLSKDRWKIKRLDNTVDLGLDGVERVVRN